MKKLSKHLPLFLLFIAIIVGAFFRFYKIGDSPKGVYVDEAALGYNAYSILKTGKDEFGKAFPIMFRSFATFQSPVYTYLTVPFISMFGLSSFSTRLPSALFGLLTIPLLYFLVKQLSGTDPVTKNQVPRTNHFALFSALLLAISPWHIQYSRTAYESNIALFFLLLGSLLFIKALKKPWLFTLSALSFGISFIAYRAEILIVPVLLAVFTVRFGKVIITNLKSFLFPIFIGSILGLVVIAPTVLILRTPGFQARTSAMNIFSLSLQAPWGYKEGGGPLEKLTNNPQLLSGKEFLSLYSSYLSPRYMFSLGDSGPRKPYTDLGTFYAWQFPFFLVGLYLLLKSKDQNGLKTFILTLLLVSPIPAALTRDPYSTLRSLPLVVPIILIISYGLVKIFEINWRYANRWKYTALTILILLSSLKMFISAFYHHDYFRSVFWNYGWQNVVESFQDLDPTLPIIVDNSRGDSYIELLFFLKYYPATYQQDNLEVPLSEYYTNMTRNTTKHLGKITVKGFQWGVDTDNVEQYIVADSIAISDPQVEYHGLTVVSETRLPNNGGSLRILKTNPKSK